VPGAAGRSKGAEEPIDAKKDKEVRFRGSAAFANKYD
jgi:hypothetical protein